MKHKRDGFTLTEVALFLGVSGLLLIGVLAMTQTSISQQRFNDVTQTFTEFLRSAYSGASNPQSISNGRSDLAVYGKMITFGETVDLAGEQIPADEQRFFVYDIVGDASSGSGASDALAMLESVKATVMVGKEYYDASGNKKVKVEPAGIVEEYSPGWGGIIDGINNGTPFKGTILIVRMPKTGLISTWIYDDTIKVNEIVKKANEDGSIEYYNNNVKALLTGGILDDVTQRPVDFCVNMRGYKIKAETRRDVRIIKNARNISGIELIDLDGEDNKCQQP